MKKTLFFAVAVSLWLSASASAELVIGHRGLGRDHSPEPENSVLALQQAFQRGVDLVEFDVQLSGDGQVVLAHDPLLERISNGTGCVAQTPLEDLQKLQLKDGQGTLHPDLRVSTFAEALRAIRGFDSPSRPYLANIHVKVYDGLRGDVMMHNPCPRTPYRTLTDDVLNVLRQEGLLDRVLITSFDHRVLDRVRRAEPSAHVGLLSAILPSLAIRYAAPRYDHVILNASRISLRSVAKARARGLSVWVWFSGHETVKDDLDWLTKVDGVISDHPDMLRAVLEF